MPRRSRPTRTTSRSGRSRGWPRPTASSFAFTDRIPRERGLGSSAATVALGLVAGALVAGGSPDPEELLRLGVDLEGHPDNLAAALAGGVCLTWDGRIARIADATPGAADRARPGGAGRDAGRPRRASGRDRARGRRVLGRAGDAARRRTRERLGGALRGRGGRPPARALPGRQGAVARGGPVRPAGRRARRDDLGVGPDGDRLGAAGRGDAHAPPNFVSRFPGVEVLPLQVASSGAGAF